MPVRSRLMLAALFLPCLLVAACFTSERPLLSADDAVTPLPASFVMVETDGTGAIKLDTKGKATKTPFSREGKIYQHSYSGSGGFSLTIAELDQSAGVYLVQDMLETRDPSKASPSYTISYYVAKILDNTVVKYDPPSPGKTGLDAALKKAGVDYVATDSDFKFTSKDQLLAAARVYAARLIDGNIVRYRIASTPEDMAALDRDIATAEASGAGKLAAAAPLSAPAAPVQAALAGAPLASGAGPDPGAQQVDACDELAAHPTDPGRMATGLPMRSIVPARAVQACERAVAQSPHTARFRYQLGRAYEASRNMGAALASYQQAATMGYGMGWFNLGAAYAYGTGGVTPDPAAAASYYRNAIAAGIDAQSYLLEVVFAPAGYSNPAFFDALFNGKFDAINLDSGHVYLAEFMQMFRNTDGCRDVIGTAAMSKLLIGEVVGTFGQMFQALANSNRNYRPGDFGAAAQSGWNAGMGATGGLMMQVGSAQSDAQLFFDRHGCASPVARQFFRNVEQLVARM